MNNVKAYAIAAEGSTKRMAVTFDVVDDIGKVTNPNKKTNRVIVDEAVLKAVKILDVYAQSIADSE